MTQLLRRLENWFTRKRATNARFPEGRDSYWHTFTQSELDRLAEIEEQEERDAEAARLAALDKRDRLGITVVYVVQKIE